MMLSRFKKRKEAQLIQQLKLARLTQSTHDNRKEIEIYHQLADFYGKCIGMKAYPYAQEMQKLAYRKAARLGDLQAKLWLCKEILRHAAAKESWLSAGVFSNDLHQKDYHEMYAHAQKMLSRLADESLEAKLMLGIIRLNGWGEPVNLIEAYQYLVDIIDEENAWDRLEKLFSNIKIQRPNFFDELVRFRIEGLV